MPNNCLSVLYKHIIQVENKNVGLKVGGGGEGGNGIKLGVKCYVQDFYICTDTKY